VAAAIDVPLIVFGTSNVEKDAEVLPAVAEACGDKPIVLGPVQDKNYKKVGAAALAYGHTVIANSPIDVNLAKQLNILLGHGVKDSRIRDPTTGVATAWVQLLPSWSGPMAALTQEDDAAAPH
jgi:acetyl-CoA decarbonylase/synthase complex subunit delta